MNAKMVTVTRSHVVQVEHLLAILAYRIFPVCAGRGLSTDPLPKGSVAGAKPFVVQYIELIAEMFSGTFPNTRCYFRTDD
jgi:hypothetical protein